MKKIFFVFAIMCLVGTTCRKDKDLHTTIEGTVKDATTLAPIPNATILLLRKESECFSCSYNLYKTFSADGNGKYFYEFTREKEYSYVAGARAQKYFDDDTQINISIGKNKKDILLHPAAYLKLHIKNTQPVDIYDAIEFQSFAADYDFYGMAIDTTFLYCRDFDCKEFGNQTNTVQYWVTKNGITTYYSASVYCPSFDTTMYNINY